MKKSFKIRSPSATDIMLRIKRLLVIYSLMGREGSPKYHIFRTKIKEMTMLFDLGFV